MADSRLNQSEVDAFVTELQSTLPAASPRLWLTLLDDASPGQLRVRKLIMMIVDDRNRRSREWYSTSPAEDRWEEIDSDEVRSSADILAIVKVEFARVLGSEGKHH